MLNGFFYLITKLFREIELLYRDKSYSCNIKVVIRIEM